jgi:alkylated DNA nucleotide flippase Atl1
MPIHDYQVAGIMVLVKLARSMETGSVDTYVDLAAYAGIMGQLHTEENELYV